MRRRILIIVLGLGTVLGFGSGIASVKQRCAARRASFERHVAHICAEAAKHPERAPATDEPGW
jgi:hypothetical protein